MQPLITICARKGSKGLPGKNIREFNGRPLIEWTIEAADILTWKSLATLPSAYCYKWLHF